MSKYEIGDIVKYKPLKRDEGVADQLNGKEGVVVPFDRHKDFKYLAPFARNELAVDFGEELGVWIVTKKELSK